MNSELILRTCRACEEYDTHYGKCKDKEGIKEAGHAFIKHVRKRAEKCSRFTVFRDLKRDVKDVIISLQEFELVLRNDSKAIGQWFGGDLIAKRLKTIHGKTKKLIEIIDADPLFRSDISTAD